MFWAEDFSYFGDFLPAELIIGTYQREPPDPKQLQHLHNGDPKTVLSAGSRMLLFLLAEPIEDSSLCSCWD